MTPPTRTIIAPTKGSGTTGADAGGRATAKTCPKGLPKVSNNLRGGLPRTAKKTVPSSVMIVSQPDGAPSDNHERGTSKKSTATKRSVRGTTKQAVKEKKEKKKKLLEARKEEEDSLLDSYIALLDGEEKFIADCASTEKRKEKEGKGRSSNHSHSRGGTKVVGSLDGKEEDNDSVEESVIVGDLEESVPMLEVGIKGLTLRRHCHTVRVESRICATRKKIL